jgi:uncharacterized protein
MKTVALTGGTGLIGTALIKHLLRHNYQIIVFTRNPGKAVAKGKFGNQVTYAAWDVKAQTIDEKALSTADYIIHLAGAGVVDHAWTDKYKREIIDSRVNSSKLLLDTLKKIDHHVTAFVSASATGWYGPDTQQSLQHGFIESDGSSKDFLGETCRLWEESTEPAEQMGIRRVVLRTGIVLSKKGGALAEFIKPIKLGVAGVLGKGKQMVSWIHIDDMCELYLYALEHENMNGIYNAVGPNPVTNQELTLALAKAMKGNAFIKMNVPEFILKLMMGDRSIEILKSTTVSSKKAEATGFRFQWPFITEAVTDLVK